MKVATEALQLFGGAGTSREYPIEKLFRDARAALIEDGENNILTMRSGVLASSSTPKAGRRTNRRQHTTHHQEFRRTKWPSTPSSSTAPAATPAC